MKTITAVFCVVLGSFGCTGQGKRYPNSSEYFVNSSVTNFQTKLGQEQSSLGIWIGRDSSTVSEGFLNQLLGSVRFTPAGGAEIAPAVSSKNTEQSIPADSVQPEPVEIVFSLPEMVGGGWNRLALQFPEPVKWADLRAQSSAQINFRVESFPVVPTIEFGEAAFDVRFSEPVDGGWGVGLAQGATTCCVS